jgi:hypothetical protein
MKKLFIFLLLSFIGGKLFAQAGACPVDISAIIINVPTCGASDGAFDIQTGFRGSDPAQVSLNGFATWQDDAATPGTVHFTGMAAGTYTVSVRSSGNTGSICQTSTFSFVSSLYDTTAVLTTNPATGCFNTDGSIVISGLTAPATDSVSWLSNINPTFVTVASLTSGNTITGLIPGHYYVTLKAAGSNFCYSTQKVTVGNSGVACAAPTFCGNASDPNNLFPNGTFGSGGNADGSNAQINGPALAAGLTQYTYQKMGYRGPEDGFYAVTNNTYLGSDYLGADPTGPNGSNTPFNGQWYDGYDHDFAVTGVKNGYQLVVNASYKPNIAIQQTIPAMCVNKKYQFSAWIRNLDQPVGLIPARVEFIVNGVGLYTTPVIPTGPAGKAWQQVGFTFQTNTPTVTISIRNDTTGGFGNDWALDDIYIGDCQPITTLLPQTYACGSLLDTATGTVTDASNIYDTYQWIVNRNDGNGFVTVGPIVTVPGFNASLTHTYTAKVALPTPLLAANAGWTYKLILGTTAADISSPSCYFADTTSLVVTSTCNTILPIKLVSIQAQQLNDNTAQVVWQVASQTNVKYYVLEKSIDGKSYDYVTSVPANNSSDYSYSADDNTLYDGYVNYYRIKEVDQDGTVYYSTIVTVNPAGNANDQILIYPNPVVDNLHISKPQTTVIKNAVIIDAIGQTILSVPNFNNITNNISLAALPTGFYELRVIDSKNEITNLKFIKQ